MRLVGAISSHQYKKALSPILPLKMLENQDFSMTFSGGIEMEHRAKLG